MTLDLTQDARKEALASIRRYFEEHLDGGLSGLAAAELLDFFLEEVGPCIYNKAVADVQERLQARVADLEHEVFEDEFQYWRNAARRKKGRV